MQPAKPSGNGRGMRLAHYRHKLATVTDSGERALWQALLERVT